MSKLGFFIIVIFVFIADKNKEAVGLYGTCVQGSKMCVQLELKDNGLFEYAYWIDNKQTWEIINGEWFFNNDTIILNEYNLPKLNLFRKNLFEELEGFEGVFVYTFLDSLVFDKVLVTAYTGKKDKEITYTDTLSISDSLFLSKELNISAISFRSLKDNTGVIWFLDSLSNSVSLSIYDLKTSDSFYEDRRIFKNKMILKNNRLYYLSSNNKPLSRYLEKTSIKNKLF